MDGERRARSARGCPDDGSTSGSRFPTRARGRAAPSIPLAQRVQISQDGAEPPSAASAALKALPTTFAVIASLRPIGVPRGGIPRQGSSLPTHRNARRAPFASSFSAASSAFEARFDVFRPNAPSRSHLRVSRTKRNRSSRRVGDALRVEIQIERDLLDESRVAGSARCLLEPIGDERREYLELAHARPHGQPDRDRARGDHRPGRVAEARRLAPGRGQLALQARRRAGPCRPTPPLFASWRAAASPRPPRSPAPRSAPRGRPRHR